MVPFDDPLRQINGMRQYYKSMTELNPSVVKEAKSESHFFCNKICLIFFFKQHFKDVQYHCTCVLVFMFAGPVRMGMCYFCSIRHTQGKLTHI